METRHWLIILLTCLNYNGPVFTLDVKSLPAGSNEVNLEWYNGTLSYWPFESFGIDDGVRDWSGTNHGTSNGDIRPIPGIVGMAIELTGNASWVDFGLLSGTCLNEPMSCKTGFTIAFWLKLPVFEGNKIIIQMANSRNARGFTVWTRRQRKKINFSINDRNAKYHSAIEWPTEDWTHITLVWHRKERNLTVYFNCTLVDSVSNPTKNKKDQDNSKVSLMLGASHSKKKRSHMLMDEFAIWNNTLSSFEICRIVGVKTVHGGYSEWSSYNECNKTCGIERRIRYRTCTNPPPQNRGLNCSYLGPDHEIDYCHHDPCPVDGGYSNWIRFSRCTKSCGGGQKFRTRRCTNPKPAHGGKNCSMLGDSLEATSCNIQPCPIHGGLSEWSEWSKCSKSCGNGTYLRYRNCTNPAPAHGGDDCIGETSVVYSCNERNCPIDGGYSNWESWSNCSKSCGNGTKIRFRYCTNPTPMYDGKDCNGSDTDTKFCNANPCPINGGFTSWSKFSKCSKSCGNGTQYRYRNCTNPAPAHGGHKCVGEDYFERDCNTHHCPVDGGYSMWSFFSNCSKSCGNGTKSRTRSCTNPIPMYKGKDCSVLGPETERFPCNTNPCPVDGGFTKWKEFSKCSTSCGNGTKYRYRNCTNPVPQYGGNNCSRLGPDFEFRNCNMHECPVHGGYSQWTSFTKCSKTCGNGTRYRFRNCNNPLPKFGGNNCSLLGEAEESIFCNTHYCAIDGGYSSWTVFSICSKPCGNGTKFRTRNCTNPTPQYGGKNCSILGADIEILNCNVHFCPIDGGYTLWSNYTECSRSCGGGVQSRNRTCTNPTPLHGGEDCIGPSNQTQTCNIHPCPIHGRFSSWSSFTVCSKSCGIGFKSRNRTCSNPAPRHGGMDCEGIQEQNEVCNTQPCPINGGYTAWSNYSECSKSCGIGVQQRYRNCTNPIPQHGGADCSTIGASLQERVCNTHTCPIHGRYSEWTRFTDCTKSCAIGTKTRVRFCDNPKPKYGGLDCDGKATEVRSCNEHPCPIHGGYTAWSNFSACSKSCENGTKNRFRNCTNPTPMHGGTNCNQLGPDFEIIPCNTHYCPIHGNYSQWTNYTMCSKSCGNGTMFRTRNCSNPTPAHGGRNCSHIGPSIITKLCNVFPCPIDGKYTLWSAYSPCDKTCNNGTKFRTRNCTKPAPQFGGQNCSRFGSPIEIVRCFLRHCPIDGRFDNWSGFGPCSKSCETGKKNRTRSCNSPRPQHGGKDCEGPSVEVIECNTHPCPIHGNYTEWSEFSPCSKTCESGVRIKTRNCTNPEPKYGGRNCSVLGKSVFRLACNPQRCPDIVFNITLNLTDETWRPSLNDSSSDDYYSVKYEIQSSIKKIYPKSKNKGIFSKVDMWRIRKGSVLVDILLKYYNELYSGITPLQDAIYTKGKLGAFDVAPVSLYTIDVPLLGPEVLSGYNVSSTSIFLSWNPIDAQYTNGNITNYRIIYKPFHKDSERDDKSILVPNQLRFVVTGLKKFTRYVFRLAGKNERGIGLDGKAVVVSTDEDTPLKPPPAISAHNISSQSIYVSWTTISEKYIPGYLIGFRVYYCPLDNKTCNSSPVDVKPIDNHLIITGLGKFTWYKVSVTGFTRKGDGPAAVTHVQTDEDIPSKAPQKLSAHNTSSTSIKVHWKPIPSQFVQGVLQGYEVSYLKAGKTNVSAQYTDKRVKAPTTSLEIHGLEKFTEYLVQVSGYTVKGVGKVSKSVKVWTDEDKPEAPPVNVTGFNESSTELYVEWEAPQLKLRNGRLIGYTIFYSQNRTNTKHALTVAANRTDQTEFVILDNLLKFTWYKIQIAAFTRKGLGPKSPAIVLQTSEDVPSESAIAIKAKHTSHKSLLVEWNPIPKNFIHGILLGYRVRYWATSNDTYIEIKKTSPDVHRIELKNLLIYTKYAIRVLGFTSAGDGAISNIIHARTDESTPGAPPVNLKALNKTSPTKISVRWEPIRNPYDVHGILRGYKLFYKPVAVSNQTLTPPQKFITIVLKPKQTSIELQGLNAFTRYHFYVLAFTIKGNGYRTHIVAAETCNCHRMLHTNWWPSPPYVEDPGSFNNSGIVPPVLENAVKTCCEDCLEFPEAKINYTKTPNGKPAMKKGLQEFRDNIDSAELSFPVYGFMDQKVYSGTYGFAPLVSSPGVAMIIIGDEEGTAAKLLIRSIILCWPIVFLDIMLLWVLSIVIWFVETFENSRHFPHNMLQGTWEGMWWAFASMTTLGYGDRIPRTQLGRLIGIVWILIGVILIACFNSTMTSILTARILDKDTMLYGTTIAAIENSSEYRFGVRKNARVNPTGKKYSNLQEIYDAMVSRDVKGILVDAYTAGSRSELFNRTDIRINKLFDYSAAYGVVLGGESKKLQQCFHSYLSEQRSFISHIIEKKTQTVRESGKKLSVERSQGLFDPKFPTYLKTVIICSALLVLIFLLGAKFTCAKKIGWITFKKSGNSKKYKQAPVDYMLRYKTVLRREMSFIVEIFMANCQRQMSILKYKHLKELQELMRMKNENNYEPVQKGSFTKNNLWSIKCNPNGNAFSTSLFKNHEQRNGLPNGFSFPKRFRKQKELETVV